eukprot:383460-Rhodomonas_salina.2
MARVLGQRYQRKLLHEDHTSHLIRYAGERGTASAIPEFLCENTAVFWEPVGRERYLDAGYRLRASTPSLSAPGIADERRR